MRRSVLIAGCALAVAILIAVVGVRVQAKDPGTTGLGFDDPYTQIMTGQLQQAQIPVQPDGKPTFFIWGRYYTGPNGLEIRLHSDGTWSAIETIMAAESLLTGTLAAGSLTTMGSVVIANISKTRLRQAATVAGIVGAPTASDIAKQVLLGNACLGMTVPPGGVGKTLNRALGLMAGQPYRALTGPYANDIKVWFEPCPTPPVSRSDPRLASRSGVPAAPLHGPEDTRPEQKAAPQPTHAPAAPATAATQASGSSATQTPPTTQPKPPATTHPKATPTTHPKVEDYNVSMDDACRNHYGDQSYGSAFEDFDNAGSWFCTNGAGERVSGIQVQEWFCDVFVPGSKASLVADNVNGWRCRK